MGTSNERDTVLCFHPQGEALLFNSNAMLNVDPTQAETVERALKQGRRQIEELVGAMKGHPAFHHAVVDFESKKLGVPALVLALHKRGFRGAFFLPGNV